MYSHNHGHTNDGECLGYGYTKLTYSGQYIDLSSGNPYGTYQYYYAPYFTYYTYWYYYGDNERCYWGIYAPGATKLRFELTTNLDVIMIYTYYHRRSWASNIFIRVFFFVMSL